MILLAWTALLAGCTPPDDDPATLLVPGLVGRSVTVTGDRLVVATGDAVKSVDGHGTVEDVPLPGKGAVAAAVDPHGGVFVADGTGLRYHERPGADAAWTLPGAVEAVEARCDQGAWLLRPDGVVTWGTTGTTPFGTPQADLLGMTKAGCDHLVAWSHDRVYDVSATATSELATLPAPIRGAVRTGDAVAAIAGDPPRLWRVADGKADDMGPAPAARAIVAGEGDSLDPAHLYLLEDDAVTWMRRPW